MTIRGKLLALVFLPVALVAILVGIDVRDRLDRLDGATRSRDVAQLTRTATDALNTLGRELVADNGVIPEGETTRSLADARATAVKRFHAAAIAINPDAVGPELKRALERADERLKVLDASREGSDFDRDAATRAMDAIAEIPAFGSRSVADSELSRRLVGWSGMLGLARTDVEVLDIVTTATTGTVDGDLIDRAARVRADIGRNEGLFQATWPAESVARANSLLKGGRVMAFDDALDAVATTPIGERADIDRTAVIERLRIRTINRQLVTNQLGDDVVGVANDRRSAARRDAVLTTLAAVAGSLAVTFLALLLANRLTRRIRSVTSAADHITEDYLPNLVSRLATGEEIELPPSGSVDGGKDEVGRLGAAIDKLQSTVVEVADSQTKLLRRGVSDIFVKLARRNQRLLERQLHFLDELEADERDPDQLRRLFHLDHLATRMRRNAENLLVIAGSDPGRRSVGQSPLAEMIQASVAETEDFDRFSIGDVEGVFVEGRAVVDTVHLVAELLENAAQFSPPTSTVTVTGQPHEQGYVLRVTDHGLGMDVEQLASANALLEAPPALGLTMSRTLGLVVVARLAQRHGIRVFMQRSGSGGTEALVLLPANIIVAFVGADTTSRDAVFVSPQADSANVVGPGHSGFDALQSYDELEDFEETAEFVPASVRSRRAAAAAEHGTDDQRAYEVTAQPMRPTATAAQPTATMRTAEQLAPLARRGRPSDDAAAHADISAVPPSLHPVIASEPVEFRAPVGLPEPAVARQPGSDLAPLPRRAGLAGTARNERSALPTEPPAEAGWAAAPGRGLGKLLRVDTRSPRSSAFSEIVAAATPSIPATNGDHPRGATPVEEYVESEEFEGWVASSEVVDPSGTRIRQDSPVEVGPAPVVSPDLRRLRATTPMGTARVGQRPPAVPGAATAAASPTGPAPGVRMVAAGRSVLGSGRGPGFGAAGGSSAGRPEPSSPQSAPAPAPALTPVVTPPQARATPAASVAAPTSAPTGRPGSLGPPDSAPMGGSPFGDAHMGPAPDAPPQNFTPHLRSGASALPKRQSVAAVPHGTPPPLEYGAPLGYGVARRNQAQMDLLTGLSRAVARGQARRAAEADPNVPRPIRATEPHQSLPRESQENHHG